MLASGHRLGPYEVLEPLGRGGMGEVYRAHDPRLHRDVAIKVLLPEVVADADRLMRFTREAHALATLNHPNVAAVYAVESTDRGPALVMEFVEGQTLADKVAANPLSWEDTVVVLRQVAAALAAAHDAGILHRDLKPANVRLKSDGTVKVLDFGLAKPLSEAHEGRHQARRPLDEVPTMTSPALTHAGILLGTAAYMAPEQIRARAIDRRADVWSFGCLAYELLTGRSPFARPTQSETLAAVVADEPDWSAVRGAVPPRGRRLLERCLRKDPQRRLRDFGDIILELEDDERETREQAASATPPRSSGRTSRWTLLPWTVAATSLLLAVFLLLAKGSSNGPSAGQAADEVLWASIEPPEDPASAFLYGVALSPDGGRLAFVALHQGQLGMYLRDLSRPGASFVPGTEGAAQPFWSPDGKRVAFFRDGI